MEEPEELGLCGLYLFILTRLEKCLKYLLINSFTIVRIGSFRVNLNLIMKITLSSKKITKNQKTVSRKNGSLLQFYISLVSDFSRRQADLHFCFCSQCLICCFGWSLWRKAQPYTAMFSWKREVFQWLWVFSFKKPVGVLLWFYTNIHREVVS